MRRLPHRDEDAAMSYPYLIDGHVAHLRASGYSERTVQSRQELLRRLDAWLPAGLAFAATGELEKFLSKPDWSRWTRCTYAMHVRAFYRWAARSGDILDGDPTIDMAHPRTPRCHPNPVTDEELHRALARSPEPWYTIILLAAAGGLRTDEVAELRREDVTADTIRIRKGKGGNPEAVSCHPAVWAHLRDRLPGPLVTSAGRPVSGRWISAKARAHFDAIGMPDVHMHRFRHYFATALNDRGVDAFTIRDLMRHRSVTSTQIYTAVRSGQRQLAIATLAIPTLGPAEH